MIVGQWELQRNCWKRLFTWLYFCFVAAIWIWCNRRRLCSVYQFVSRLWSAWKTWTAHVSQPFGRTREWRKGVWSGQSRTSEKCRHSGTFGPIATDVPAHQVNAVLVLLRALEQRVQREMFPGHIYRPSVKSCIKLSLVAGPLFQAVNSDRPQQARWQDHLLLGTQRWRSWRKLCWITSGEWWEVSCSVHSQWSRVYSLAHFIPHPFVFRARNQRERREDEDHDFLSVARQRERDHGIVEQTSTSGSSDEFHWSVICRKNLKRLHSEGTAQGVCLVLSTRW